MAQNLVIVLDGIKSHWEVQQTAFIDATTQSITLPLVISAIKALESALFLQNSENTMKIYVAVGNTIIPGSIDKCKIVSGTI